MGKISCEACRKSCKGQAIRLQERYYHVKCFKCRECKKQLATGGFYSKDGVYYCQEDYQKLYGTKCSECHKFVEGEVVTALGKTYHIDCFHCTRCSEKFSAGDKVTFTGQDYLCSVCLDLTTSEVTTPATDAGVSVASTTSPAKKAKPGVSGAVPPLSSSTPRQYGGGGGGDTQLSSPVSDMSDISTDKENIRNGTTLNNRDLMSPLSTTSGYKSDASSDRGTLELDRSSEFDFLGTSLNSEHKERLSPIQNILSYRSPSPAASTVSKVSKNTRDSSTSYNSRFDMDFGKFYNTSYLNKPGSADYKKGPSINPNIKSRSPHFHRPENFSYMQVRKDFIRPLKKEDSTVGDAQKYKLKQQEPVPLMKNKEAIEMSKFPDGQKPEEGYRAAIEREDWPAPPDPAAAFPELLRSKRSGQGRRSCPTSAAETTDTELDTEVSEWEDEPDFKPVDPKIQREIDYLLKHGGAGAARAFIRDMERSGAESPTLDPVSASRTPAANKEPHYKLRYETPVFASPSRDLEGRPRLYSMDDQLVGVKYRSTTQTVANFPTPRPGYGLAPRSSTHSTADSREAGYFSDTGFVRHSLRHNPDMYDYRNGGDTTDGETTTAETLEGRSFYSSQSSMEEFDPTTGLRRSKMRSSTISSEGLSTPSYMGYKRPGASFIKSEAPPTIYPYENLKITNPHRPAETEINSLERHLSKEEFESLFKMSREAFYRLAEWKRNDMKKRIHLF